MKCDLCRRVGDRGFQFLWPAVVQLDDVMMSFPGFFICKAEAACRKRQRQATRTAKR